MLKIGIIGAGIGGMTAAIALRQSGHDVTVFEQSQEFGRVGADINLTPNAVRALDRLDLGPALRKTAAQPTHRISRMWDTGEETSKIEMRDSAQESYGAPQLTIHRADLLTALQEKLPAACFRMGHKAQSLTASPDAACVTFDNGQKACFDLLIGADGIHSAIRTALFGPENPEFTGLVSYRGTYPTTRTPDLANLEAFTKWWGPTPERQVVVFPLSRGDEIFVFATTGQKDWTEESWTAPGDIDVLRAAYADFHPEARAILAALDTVTRSALYVRDPMPSWSKGSATLLGDAAHPMTPFMAQGACMAIEDAVVLARCLTDVSTGEAEPALARYEAARKDRTAKVQIASRGNEWLKKGGNADWLYAYDAWGCPI